jgi:Cu2+-containing amine oxidase
MAVLAFKPATHTKRVWMAASGERRNNEGAKVSIELVWRHDDTRPHLPDFRSSRRIQRDKEDIAS